MPDMEMQYEDYVTINDTNLYMIKPSLVAARFEQFRNEYFDQELEATPIVSAVNDQLRPERYSATEQEQLNYAPYDFENSVDEPRFKNDFDFYAGTLRAVQINANRVGQLRRLITQEYYVVHAQYTHLYSECVLKYGSKALGSNTEERKAWFRSRYRALADIDELYSNFLDEIEIETERLQTFGSYSSRALSATEASYRAQGKLFDKRVVEH